MKCERCKADVETRYAATRYCHKCKVLARREASERYRQKNHKKVKTRCHRIDWVTADAMIADGRDNKEIAEACGCSAWSIQNRRYKTIEARNFRATGTGPVFDYAKHLAEWLEEVRGKFGGGRDREAFKVWLMTPDGQGLLQQINEEGGI